MSDNSELHDERISKLYQLGDSSEPPSHLDRDIKQAARAATPAKKRRFVWPSLATAAVLVLSISLVLKVLQQPPLEETAISSAPNGGEGISLQESADMAVETMDAEESKLRRDRSIKQKTTPAFAQPQQADSIKLEAAPTTPVELIAKRAAPKKCSGIKLPEINSRVEWIRLYQETVEQGESATASCLQQAYQTKFGHPMPLPVEK